MRHQGGQLFQLRIGGMRKNRTMGRGCRDELPGVEKEARTNLGAEEDFEAGRRYGLRMCTWPNQIQPSSRRQLPSSRRHPRKTTQASPVEVAAGE